MKRPGYREAIHWIAFNDDTEWLTDEDQRDLDGNPFWSVTACMVADLFGVSIHKVAEDALKALKKAGEI
jgi:hypothetical protein